MNRDDLQRIAKIRLKEAKLLLDGGQSSGAYYLCGYVVECALKACIAKKTKRYDFPDKDQAQKSYTHKAVTLVSLAGLNTALNDEIRADQIFATNWKTVTTWDASSRYTIYSRMEAEDLYTAITHRRHGILKWIKQHW